ncbi:MAG TPA: acetyl-CoA C-acyltransferase [Solibacterales bacterium]|nr:acetyl-CoA C-acyltransferase [Bryobacterales bacterium]
MKEAVIAAAVRTAVGKAPKGTLRSMRPDDLAAIAIRGALKKVPQVIAREIDDVIIGCAMPEGEQGMNVARIASLRAGIPIEAAAMTVNRFCASGLQAIALAAERIRGGGGELFVAGGTESMSMVPMGGNKISINPWLQENYPESYCSMGLTAERVARHYGIDRDKADQFAYESHQKALAAQAAGKFDEEVIPVHVPTTVPDAKAKPITSINEFKTDEGPRADTSYDALAKLKPAFHAKGTVTAGNSSQTSDGAAAAVILSEEKAKELGVEPLARFVSFAYAGCLPEEMGVGPVHAIPKALKLAGLTLDQIELIELNEAFAAQSLAVIKELGLDLSRVNVNGGAIALGHPLGCTGAKLTATLLQEMKRRNARYGMVTMCVGGGMGAAGIFENLSRN